MESVILYIFGSVLLVSLVAVIAAIPLLCKKKVSKNLLLVLMSLSVGTLLGGVFIHFLPEILHDGYHVVTAIYVLVGFLVFFIIEQLVHYHHTRKCEHEDCGHSHAYHLAPVNLIGDGIHNFIDGMVIAGTYLINIPLGIAATVSILFHEVPQEIADFGILLYSGYSKKKALTFNLISALTAVIGAILAIILSGLVEGFSHFIIPFAAGNFVYIAASNIVPELHKHHKIKNMIFHTLAIIVGISIMLLLLFLAPEHAH